MKRRRIPGRVFLLVFFLLVLAACTAADSGAKLTKANLPDTITIETEDLQPALTQGIEPTSIVDCTDTDPHPIGESIAQTYQVPYEQVMTWFCSGYSFDNILIALETSAAVDIPPDVLLNMLLEKEWEEIWADVGLTGTP